MGVYLVSVDEREWFGEDEGGHADVASGLNEELRRRGLPPYETVSGAAVGGGWFEEKVSPSMQGFAAFCEAHLTEAERDTLLGWTVLVPLCLEERVLLPVGSAYWDETVIAGAPQILALAERLAGILDLPLDVIPATGGNLELTAWFLDGEAVRATAARPGPWSADLDTAFYAALYLRAAQYSLRYGCPLVYS
ncbi:hypothetical protein [Streptomyces aurantiogriseus]|uniref:Uncharacterized protein n=1 Tax=Streptomyces aurantiogriseus TaxID=66870 RepID=A0A918FEY8_9ACTN|nr:hypothetical protein [Streptomyces aurantiogriseus]GGR32917.1 hypothetical protein GCM10010251_56330 [Streptomyces aurantiogriseus]